MWNRRVFHKYLPLMVIFLTVALALIVVGGPYNLGPVDKGLRQDLTPSYPGTIRISVSASPHYMVTNLSQHGAGVGNPLSGTTFIDTTVLEPQRPHLQRVIQGPPIGK